MSIDWNTVKTAEDLAAEQAQRETDARIAELRKKLTDTDYKTLPDYDKDNAEILTKRQEWRDEIRELMG